MAERESKDSLRRSALPENMAGDGRRSVPELPDHADGSAGPTMVEASERRYTTRRRLDLSVEALEHLFRGSLFITDGAGQVEHLSGRALALLRRETPFSIRNGLFQIERSSLQRRLLKQLQLVSEGSTPGQDLIGIPDFSGHTRYVLRLVALPKVDGTQLVIVVVDDLQGQSGAQRANLVALFGLSEREAELAEYFARGLRIDEIADEMGISPNTARVHLRNVFSKTNSSSQVELARLMVLIP